MPLRPLLLALLAAVAAPLQAQSAPTRCAAPLPPLAEDARLGLIMADSTFEALAPFAESRFLQAYLLAEVVEHANPAHPLFQAACAFVAAKAPSSVEAGVRAQLASEAVLAALRAASEAEAAPDVDAALSGYIQEDAVSVWRLSRFPDDDLPSDLALGRAEAARRIDGLRSAVSVEALAGLAPEADAGTAEQRRRQATAEVQAYAPRAEELLVRAQKDRALVKIVGEALTADLGTVAVLAPSEVSPATEPLAASPPSPGAPNVWVGLADFVISRAQEDIISSLLSSGAGRYFEHEAARAAFPRTYQLAGAVRNQTIPPSLWRTTLADDMRALPERMLTDEAIADALFDGDPEVMRRLREAQMVYGFGERIAEGHGPLTLLQELPLLTLDGNAEPRVGPELRLAAHLLAGVASDYAAQQVQTWDLNPRTTPEYVLTPAAVRRDGPLLDLYLRLLLVESAEAPNAPLRPAEAAAFPLARVPQVAAQVETGLRSMEQMLRRLQRVGEQEEAEFDGYLMLLFDQADSLLDLAGALTPSDAERIEASRAEWRLVRDLYLSYRRASYTEVLTRTVVLLDRLKQGTALDGDLFASDRFQGLLRTATLAAAVADARTEAQLQSAFRAAALPVGSRRAKREGRGRPLYVNAYLGGVVGRERDLADADGPSAATLGVSLPIGVEVPVPVLPRLSLFAPLIDLGAVASYRFEETESDLDEGFGEVTFQQIVSPGLYLTAGIPSWPVTLGVGVQATPRLRRLRDAPEAPRADVLRWGAFLAVDVPLFSF